MNKRLVAYLLAALVGALPIGAQTSAADEAGEAIRQELSEPFCYFMVPTDQIGFKGCPKATIVTCDGAFVSAYGRLSFAVGAPSAPQPVCQRVKTLLDDYLPVIRFGFLQEGLRYDFEAYATPTDLDPRGNLITFIAVTVANPGPEARQGGLTAAFGDIAPDVAVGPAFGAARVYYQNLKHALRAQRSTVWHTRQFMDEEQFNSGLARVAYADGQVLQGGHLVFTYPTEGAAPAGPGQPPRVAYAFSLPPGARRCFTFRMPAVPVALARSDCLRRVCQADPAEYRSRTLAFWRAEVARADRFRVFDPKVMATFRTSLVNDLIASELGENGAVYQRVNRIHYNYFWVRDGAFFVRTYDMLGLHDQARATLNAFLVWQDGRPVSFFRPGAPKPEGARLSVQDDYWGQVLWAFGAHCRTTNDQALLQLVYPLLAGHIAEFTSKCAADPRGLWPVAGPYDNEAIDGHYTGHSFWALLGLKYAIAMAREMNRPADAAAWQKIHDDYQANFLRQLRELAAKTEGYIPPGMDSPTDGNDWDNASGGLYPFEVLARDDPLARQTLKMVRDFNYREGIITYGGNAWVAKQRALQGKPPVADGTLHHYEIFYVTEGNTILGEQRKVVEDLYSILAHTGSTNSGFEFGIPAWSTRDPGDNFPPHGWFAARFMSQVRNCLVREEGQRVHIASVLAPNWVEAGREVEVHAAPTYFGSVSYTLACRADGATLTFANAWRPNHAPEAVVLHVPWFISLSAAQADGRPVQITDQTLVLPAKVRRVELRWAWNEEPKLSYEEAVRLYLEQYYRQPGASFLFPQT